MEAPILVSGQDLCQVKVLPGTHQLVIKKRRGIRNAIGTSAVTTYAKQPSRISKSHLQQPFQGEYLGLKENSRYRKLLSSTDDKLVMADNVRKVNRGDGKASPRLFLLTKSHVILADPKAAQPKTVITLSDIDSVSVSRYSDGFFVLHLKESSTAGSKGDFLLISDHLIELVTRLHQTVLETTKQRLKLQVTDEFLVKFKQGSITVKVVETAQKQGTAPVCRKKGSRRMEVLVH
uniref:Uncharacterized protein n=1 Tax=Sphaerodactylus townsendi TaxID=933632 RepID=A0ACB8ENG4_9SAUR